MEDIFYWCRENNSIQVRLWLDDTEHDMNQGYLSQLIHQNPLINFIKLLNPSISKLPFLDENKFMTSFNVFFLRFLEMIMDLVRCIGVLKKDTQNL